MGMIHCLQEVVFVANFLNKSLEKEKFGSVFLKLTNNKFSRFLFKHFNTQEANLKSAESVDN